MRARLLTQGVLLTCSLFVPFLGCSGEVPIGGDPMNTGPSSGGSANPGTGGSSSAGTTANTGGSHMAGTTSVAGSTGVAGTTSSNECVLAEQAVRGFIAANKACTATEDCQTQQVGCQVTEDGCTGVVYLNNATDLTVFNGLRADFYECFNDCAVCERLDTPPECIGGFCRRAGSQAEVCSLPFDQGSCDALFPVYASVNGVCVERIYGGCDGNANRFQTLEECLATCEGRPSPNPCPEGREPATVCLGCGPSGGCGASAEVCAMPCDDAVECSGQGLACWDGYCQVGGCI